MKTIDVNLPKLTNDEIFTIESGLNSKNPIVRQKAEMLLDKCIDDEIKNPTQDSFIPNLDGIKNIPTQQKGSGFLNTVNDIGGIVKGLFDKPKSTPVYTQQSSNTPNIPPPDNTTKYLVIGGIGIVVLMIVILILKK